MTRLGFCVCAFCFDNAGFGEKRREGGDEKQGDAGSQFYASEKVIHLERGEVMCSQ